MIDINATLLVQMLNFFILVALLRAFAYKPIAKALEARSNRIASSIQKADEDQKKAEELVQKYEKELSSARVKAQEIVDQAAKRAEEERLLAIEETKKEVAKMKEAAKEALLRQEEDAKRSLKGEVVSLSLLAAEKILARNIDSDTDKNMVADFIEKLDKDKLGDLSC